ncbi:HD domain-containing protein [Actinacidiphila acididurans]|uniref:Metal-dependent HD superfamily phosphohydrolase n=1 Tax=Actinacidiphila acididurans TaxID=2784346 RepID=A0ABS2TPB6_9ACTN|nr:hypothetical protein [Actinacidiphila acididurans]MBM9505184.1 hypothetical protein [Actinacidiphila acididurans]
MPPTSAAAVHPRYDALLAEWGEVLRRCQSDPDAAPDPAPYGRELLERWAEPQRHYHTMDHLVAVLSRVTELTAYAGDPDTVVLAAWFHDAVYRPDRSENEERSAALAERALDEAGLSGRQIAEVARLVRLTVSHNPASDDRNGEVLCDADLAVLAGDPADYAAYAAAVREEYGFVPDERFRPARADILRRLLDLPTLFRTAYGQDRWEATARRNMTTELELLES